MTSLIDQRRFDTNCKKIKDEKLKIIINERVEKAIKDFKAKFTTEYLDKTI